MSEIRELEKQLYKNFKLLIVIIILISIGIISLSFNYLKLNTQEEIYENKYNVEYITKDGQKFKLKYYLKYKWIDASNRDAIEISESSKHNWIHNYVNNGLKYYIRKHNLEDIINGLEELKTYCDINEINKYTISLGIQVLEFYPLEFYPKEIKKITPKTKSKKNKMPSRPKKLKNYAKLIEVHSVLSY